MSVTHIRVTNKNSFAIEDRYDGVPYTFEPNKERLVPIEAAALIFGFPVDENGIVVAGVDGQLELDSEYVQRRWGWNTVQRHKDEEMADAVDRTNKAAAKFCRNLHLEAVSMALREVPKAAELPAPRDGAVDADENQKMTVG